MNIPSNLIYSKEHEWAKVDGNTAIIGISQFAVDQLGDITLVELPEKGDEISKDDTIGTVESVKAVSDLFAPLSGRVIEVNTDLEDEPEKINDDCYNEGWLLKIEITQSSGLDELMDHEAYSSYLEELDE
jgi:glycine cleavage system H protein